ncbi:DNA-(apurinic or apyrimidinic site) lyase /endonuclease III [Desulfacinum hydrothermale DSM 13146]|uniref:Endonuclease III n=1 Tax=Desulfacinum hydrothermale DSM 13146 TaxID=1121390 RepID=A0A1W1XPE7_9BACT|nr:endonuclease III [Desulfacinum hydrothermale]SMC25843.1 DNA-(apurinic or apyrimidinic site) lyase /endonuclease III [Desulfacinum hydrothermale DSM 13146]
MENHGKAEKILEILAQSYGTEPWNWHTRRNPFRVLIGTVLSHRTRDEMTDAAAQAVLARYPDAASLADAPLADLQDLVRTVNFYKRKAARIKEIGRILVERHGGRVPDAMEDLLALPGVGRKTAACVLVYGFRKPAVPVDTHVHRISNRLGLVETQRPEATERALQQMLPEKWLLLVNELLVKHGQTVCRPRHPLCSRCPVRRYCHGASGH